MGQTLEDRGARVSYCELYHRRCPADANDHWRQLVLAELPRQTVLSVHSGESLDNLTQVLRAASRQECFDLPLLVPGKRVAERAAAQGFGPRIIVAANATDEAMTQALINWRESDDR